MSQGASLFIKIPQNAALILPVRFCEANLVWRMHLALAVWDKVKMRFVRGRLSLKVILEISL